MAVCVFRLRRSTPVRGIGAMVGGLFLLSACGTTNDGRGSAPGAADAGEQDLIGGLIATVPGATPGPSPKTFLGRPVAALEALTGTPALTRKEGSNEFRRYDLGLCRVYAVVTPAGGKVASLATGPAVAGNPKPQFEQCTARVVSR